MNFMRRRTTPKPEREVSGSPSAHLRRLFNQYKSIHDVKEQDDMFYELLPVFYGVLSECQPMEFVTTFPDVHAFCIRASQLLVREIKSRAANRSSEEGSSQISHFLEPTGSILTADCTDQMGELAAKQPLDVANHGWNLLRSLNLLSTGHMNLIECMVAASLPSTLVKCLYIFLDLPRDALPAKAKGFAFQPVFKQLMQRLCMCPIAVEEFARKDLLGHVFSASTDWCSEHNLVWRSTTSSILTTIAQNGLTAMVVKHIHDSACIASCLTSVSRGHLTAIELVNPFIALLHMLHESCAVSYRLLEDFRVANGYQIVGEFITKLEQSIDDSQQQATAKANSSREAVLTTLRTLIGLLTQLVACGTMELRIKQPPVPLSSQTQQHQQHQQQQQVQQQVYMVPGYAMPRLSASSTGGNGGQNNDCLGAHSNLRNLNAFDCLESLFVSARTTDLCVILLEAVRTIFLQHPAHYVILGQRNSLARLAKEIFGKPLEVQEAFFQLLESLVLKFHYIPMRELSAIAILLKSCNFNLCVSISLRSLIRLLCHHTVFRDVFRDTGLLEVGVDMLHRFTGTLAEGLEPDSLEVMFEISQLVTETLRLCVTSCVANFEFFHQLGGVQCLINRFLPLVSSPGDIPLGRLISVERARQWRASGLALVEELMLTSTSDSVMSTLLNRLHCGTTELKLEILHSFCRILRDSHLCRAAFRRASGFVYIMQELVQLEGCLGANPMRPTRRLLATTRGRRPSNGDVTRSDAVKQSPLPDPHDPAYMSRKQYLAGISYKQLLRLIRTIFITMGIGMKFEPANAHHFSTDVQFSNLTDALLRLGCFEHLTGEATVEGSASAPSYSPPAADIPTSVRSAFSALFENVHCSEAILTHPLPRQSDKTSGDGDAAAGEVDETVRILIPLSASAEATELQEALQQAPFHEYVLSRRLVEYCLLTRLVYDLAVDAYDKDSLRPEGDAEKPQPGGGGESDQQCRVRRSVSRVQHPSSTRPQTGNGLKLVETSAAALSPPSFKLMPCGRNDYCLPATCNVVHSGAVMALVHMTAVLDPQHFAGRWSQQVLDLQACLLSVVVQLCQVERNQQVLCTASASVSALPCELLTLFARQMSDESHPLHGTIHALFENLAAQSLTPSDMRRFLRINNPLSCPPTDLTIPGPEPRQMSLVMQEARQAYRMALHRNGGPLTLNQMKCLIAMATPAAAQVVRSSPTGRKASTGEKTWSVGFTTVPPFVEFDMEPEGFACLFLPSIAPQGSLLGNPGSTAAPQTLMDESRSVLEPNATGGVGVGERIFPPSLGFTFSTWFSVLRFDTPTTSPTAPQQQATDNGPGKRFGRRQSSGAHRSSASPPSAGLPRQPQAVHLLTLLRGIQSINDKLVCLRVFIHPRTRQLVVSTQERVVHPDQVSDIDFDPKTTVTRSRGPPTSSASVDNGEEEEVEASDGGSTDTCQQTTVSANTAIFPCGLPDPQCGFQAEFPTGIWRHLTLVFSRAGMIKSSSCSLYLDGCFVDSQKLTYLSTSSSSAANFTGASFFYGGRSQSIPGTVSAIVGTPASMRRRTSSLLWRQGPFHLIEEPLDSARVACITKLGPGYLGSFQSPPLVFSCTDEANRSLFAEDKLVFSINASALSTMNLAQIRKIYNSADAKAIARQCYVSSKDTVTPIRLLLNTAGHLPGPARCLGAALVGYQGIRAFQPSPAARLLHCIGGGSGGVRIGLALIAMARDIETLYAATKAMCTLVKSSPSASLEMQAFRGYQTLAMLLREKRHLLTNRILDALIGLSVGTETIIDADYTYKASSALNHPVFADLLADLDIWRVKRLAGGERSSSSSGGDQSQVKQEDYRLVASLLNHLSEVLLTPSTSAFAAAADDADAVGAADAEEQQHLGWTEQRKSPQRQHTTNTTNQGAFYHLSDIILKRVIHLLMRAHAPDSGAETSAVSRQQQESTQWSADQLIQGESSSQEYRPRVIGRKALIEAAVNFMHTALPTSLSRKWLRSIGQLMAWTLTVGGNDSPEDVDGTSLENTSTAAVECRQHAVDLCNRCFGLLLSLISEQPSVNKRLCNELVTVLGFDWLCLFLRPHVDPSTVPLAVNLLLLLVLNPGYQVATSYPADDWRLGRCLLQQQQQQQQQQRGAISDAAGTETAGAGQSSTRHLPFVTDGVAAFRIGCPAGRWLYGCESLLKKGRGLLLDGSSASSSSSAHRKSSPSIVRRRPTDPPSGGVQSTVSSSASASSSALGAFRLADCQQPGFVLLHTLLPHHVTRQPVLVYLLTAFMLQAPLKRVPDTLKPGREHQSSCRKLIEMEFDSLYSLVTSQRSSLVAFEPSPEEFPTHNDGSVAPTGHPSAPSASSSSRLPISSGVTSFVSGLLSGAALSVRGLTSSGTAQARQAGVKAGAQQVPVSGDLSASVTAARGFCSQSSKHTNAGRPFCFEAASLLLAVVRTLVVDKQRTPVPSPDAQDPSENDSPTGATVSVPHTYAEVAMRFLLYLYRSRPDFRPVAMSADFINGLVGIIASSDTPCCPSGSNTLTRQKGLPESAVSESSSVGQTSTSTIHRVTLDFLQVIVTDSFSFPSSSVHRPVHLVDILLEAWSDQCSSKAHQHLLTYILHCLMDHFIAADILTDTSLCLPTGGSLEHIPYHMVYFAVRLVDKIWQGCFASELTAVVDFLLQLLNYWQDRGAAESQRIRRTSNASSGFHSLGVTGSGHVPNGHVGSPDTGTSTNTTSGDLANARWFFCLNATYRCLNRAIFYQLSRPILSLSDQQHVLCLLNRLVDLVDTQPSGESRNEELLTFRGGGAPQTKDPGITANNSYFSPANADPDFTGCLVHLLMQLIRTDRYQASTSCNSPRRGTKPVPQRLARRHRQSVLSAPPIPSRCSAVGQCERLSSLEFCADQYYHTAFGLDEFDTGEDVASMIGEQKTRLAVAQSLAAPSGDQRETRLVRGPVDPNDAKSMITPENSELIMLGALKLWAHCYATRKADLATLVPDAPITSGLTVPSLSDWSPVLESPCLLAWTQYVDGEASSSSGIGPSHVWGRIPGPLTVDCEAASGTGGPGGTVDFAADPAPVTASMSTNNLQQHFSFRFSRMSGHMFRQGSNNHPVVPVGAASVAATAAPSRGGSEDGLPVVPSIWSPPLKKIAASGRPPSTVTILENVRQSIYTWMPHHLALLRKLLDRQMWKYDRNSLYLQQQLRRDWECVELELTRERGLWGPVEADPLARWQLDPTEGPCRMRKRLMLNTVNFYHHYPYQTLLDKNWTLRKMSDQELSLVQRSTWKSKIPCSRASRLYFLNFRPRGILHVDLGPFTPWLPMLERTPFDKEEEAGEDRLEEPTDSASGDDNGRSLTEPGDVTRPDPCLEDPEQSLQQTASILRMSVSMEAADLAAMIDETEELITLSGEEITEGGGDEEEDELAGASSTSSLTSSNGTPPAEVSSPPPPLAAAAAAAPPPVDTVKRPQSTPGASKATSPPAPTQPTGFLPNDEQFASHEAILRLLEPGERLTACYRCARVFGQDVYEGLLLFGRAHFYVIDGYTLVNDRELVDIDSLQPLATTSEAGDTGYEPIVPRHATGSTATPLRSALTMGPAASTAGQVDLWTTGAVSQTLGKQYFKFPYENVQDVHKRRYLLQPTALEIFNADGRNFLMAFSKGVQNEVYHRLKDVVSGFASAGNGPGSTFSQPLLMNQKNTSNFLSSLMGEKTVTQRWMRGELSNFQYLMYLNTLAGRSYNDLMQYPIFPWILADYDSEELDLSRPETFRDLAKPMGAQTENRLHQFQRRYREWEDPSGETPPYHYGTHYSSAMIVASYLLRMEPFTQQFLRLQGGHWDFPDRLFYSVKGAWLSASMHNMSDVRELIPEFFYLPNFLVNMNHFDLGTCQNGSKVDDVRLPPWAKGSPREFIRAHREALESEYVSAHLHEWIDLIFGYKQKGDAAVQADNVFHHLFYEGNVDIYSIDDPLKRTAVIGFINNFGQIPKQLFRKPHPSRTVAVPRFSAIRFLTSVATTASCVQSNRMKLRSHLAMDLFYRNTDCLQPCLQPIKELRHAVGQIIQLDPASLPGGSGAGAASSAPVSFPLKPTSPELDAGFVATVASAAAAAGSVGGGGGLALAAGGTPTIPGGPVLAVEQNKCLLPPHFTNYIAWGFSDGSLRLCSLLDQQHPIGGGTGGGYAGGERARCVFEMVDRSDILCCATPDKRTLVTAGISTAVRVWKISRCDTGNFHPTGNCIVANVARDPSLATAATTTPTSSTGAGPFAPHLLLRATLCGHTDTVTCLAASATFNLIVSGSRDRSCILWDLNRLCYLRQLPRHSGPVAAVAINEATGDIATCATHWLSLWDCNGRPISAVDTTISGPDKQLLCVCPSTLYDWDAENVWLTGGSDGVVHMWGIEYMRSSGPETTEEQSVITPQLELDRYLQGTDTNSPESNSDWTCRLVTRGQLTMHTAFARPDNRTPAAITAIAVSRDHRSVLVGDARGRVHVWSVPASESARAGMTDQWVRDDDTVVCASEPCSARFSLTERRHHCRNCGKVFCSRCSRFESEIYRLRIFKPVRVCYTCHALLKEIQAPRRRDGPHHSS